LAVADGSIDRRNQSRYVAVGDMEAGRHSTNLEKIKSQVDTVATF
jgi:hypothetical protein